MSPVLLRSVISKVHQIFKVFWPLKHKTKTHKILSCSELFLFQFYENTLTWFLHISASLRVSSQYLMRVFSFIPPYWGNSFSSLTRSHYFLTHIPHIQKEYHPLLIFTLGIEIGLPRPLQTDSKPLVKERGQFGCASCINNGCIKECVSVQNIIG